MIIRGVEDVDFYNCVIDDYKKNYNVYLRILNIVSTLQTFYRNERFYKIKLIIYLKSIKPIKYIFHACHHIYLASFPKYNS